MMRLALAALTLLATLRPGQVAPDFALRDQNGKSVTLSAARGSKVVLVFYRGYW
jgi:peroxiredoxin